MPSQTTPRPDQRTYQQGIAEGVRRVHSRQHASRVKAGMVGLGVATACAFALTLQLWVRVRQ
jgi:hypothetical protein